MPKQNPLTGNIFLFCATQPGGVMTWQSSIVLLHHSLMTESGYKHLSTALAYAGFCTNGNLPLVQNHWGRQ